MVEAFKQSFYGHLKELRSRLINIVIFYIIFFLISYLLFSKIYLALVDPLYSALGSKAEFIYTGVAEAFFAKLSLSSKCAFLMIMPIFAFHAYRFLEPGLYETEKKIVFFSILSAPLLFFLGLFFVYFLVMPEAFKFFVSFQQDNTNYSIQLYARISEYLSLISSLIIAFGIAFQLPIFLIILISLRLISSKNLSDYRRYSIVLIFIIAGLITPPDVLSQLLLAIPLMALYEITIIIAKKIELGRN